MKTPRNVPVNSFVLHNEDKKSVLSALNNGWISSEGPYIKEFELGLAQRFKVNYVAVVSSGTAALQVAIKALELPAGFKALVSDHTIISCASAIVTNGGSLVLVDSELEGWNQDAGLTLEAIERYDPDVVLISHVYGLPFEISKIKQVCADKQIIIVEDAAEMIGQTENNLLCGSIGDICIFSFYPNKHITTGEGGAVLTNNASWHEKVCYYRNLCFNPDRRFRHNDIGFNFRMSSMQAALGLSQLKRLDETVAIKRRNGKAYLQGLKHLESLFHLPKDQVNQNQNIYWVFGLVAKKNKFKSSLPVTELMNELGGYGVGTRPFFYSLHMQPCLEGKILNANDGFPASKYLSDNGFYLPSGAALTEEDVQYVVAALTKICGYMAHD